MVTRMAVDAAAQGGLTDDEKLENLIRLAFDGNRERFDDFMAIIRREIPPGTGVVLRGSAVTGRRCGHSDASCAGVSWPRP